MNREQYLLVCLMEECAEVQQVAAKALRFGLDNHHPVSDLTNTTRLMEELAHIEAIRTMLTVDGFLPDLTETNVSESMAKIDRVIKYMELSKDLGTLEREYD